MSRKPTNIVERILRLLPDVSDDECWVIPNKPQYDGYIQIGTEGGRPTRLLHRLVWEIHNAEPIPDGMVVMHSCDNRACCNPNHLSLGTQSANIKDSVSKGRHSCVNPRKSWARK